MDRLKFCRICFVLIFTLATFGNAQAQQPKVFSEAKGLGSNPGYSFAKWNFSVGKDLYEVEANGSAVRKTGKNISTKFRLKLEKDATLVKIVYFAKYQNDLVIISEWDDGGYGAGFITRLDGNTLKPKWRIEIPAFNVAKGIIENNSVYLAAVGYAAKVNLETGKYIWKHEDFYHKYKKSGAFNIFETPEIKGNIIVLTENQDDYNRPPNIIRFNKISGKVIKVTVN